MKPCGASNDPLVTNELRNYITAQGQKDAEKHCWKINAGPHGWGKFFEDNPHLKDTDQKPKKFCEAHSTALSWLPDDSAPGKGYITVPEIVAVMKPCGASNDPLVVNELRNYITAQDAEKHCWKINAGPHGWGKFFEDNPHLKDTDRKPKKFCEAHSAALSWLPDDSASGKGYITVPEAAISINGAHHTLLMPAANISNVFHGGSLKDVTITNDEESKMFYLTGMTSSEKETISVEKKVSFSSIKINCIRYFY